MELRDNKEQESAEWMKQHRLNSQAISRGLAARAKAMDPHTSLKEVFQEKLKQHRFVDAFITLRDHMKFFFTLYYSRSTSE